MLINRKKYVNVLFFGESYGNLKILVLIWLSLILNVIAFG